MIGERGGEKGLVFLDSLLTLADPELGVHHPMCHNSFVQNWVELQEAWKDGGEGVVEGGDEETPLKRSASSCESQMSSPVRWWWVDC